MPAGEVEDGKEKPKVDLDKVLSEEIGQFGKYHVLIAAQCILCAVFGSWNLNEYVFTAARITTRCVIPECEDPSETDFSPSWTVNAIPWSGGSMDNCQRYGNSSLVLPGNDSCPALLFDTSIYQQCDKHLYANTETIVYDFELACDEWRRALVGSVRVSGMMVALAIFGYVSDRWGRRRTLIMNGISNGVFGMVRYWSTSYPAYISILFFESIMGCSLFTTAFIIIGELLGPQYRVAGGAAMNMIYAIGTMMLGIIAWAVGSWRNIILVLYIPQFITIVYIWTMPESLRWLLSKGKFTELERLLKKAAQVNGKQLSQISLDELKLNAVEKKKAESSNDVPLVLLVLRNKEILIRCFVSCTWWITCTLVYYGLSINSVNLSGNKYLNYVISAFVEIPGCVIMLVLLDRIGRKPTMIIFFWICAASQVAFIFISKDMFALSLAVYMLGKCCIAVVLAARNVYTLELFPTECRHRMFAFSSMVGRLGSFVAPLTPALGATFFAELPFVLFGGMAFFAGLVTFLVPDTMGLKLADNINESLNIKQEDKTAKTYKFDDEIVTTNQSK